MKDYHPMPAPEWRKFLNGLLTIIAVATVICVAVAFGVAGLIYDKAL